MEEQSQAAGAGQEPFRTRTSVLFASAAATAVVLRRGPKTHWQLLVWDLKTDTFTPGQWMKGDVALCDLSPRGDKLLYFASQYHRSVVEQRRMAARPFDPLGAPAARPNRLRRKVPRYMRSAVGGPGAPKPIDDTWTAISTPPYFTALALWPAHGRWTGGGIFRSNEEIIIAEPPDRMVPVENVLIPARMRIRSYHTGSTDGSWTMSAKPPSEGRDLRSGPFWQGMGDAGAEWVDWVHVELQEQLVFACDGRIYRLRGWRDVPASKYLQQAKTLTDLREARFTLMAAPPSALRW